MENLYRKYAFMFTLMKHSVIQLLMTILFVGATYAHVALGQEILDQPIVVKAETTTLKKALENLERTTNVFFVYNPREIEITQTVTLTARAGKLKEALNQLLLPLQIRYEVAGKQILLFKKENSGLPEPSLRTVTQPVLDYTINGKVSDNQGEGLPGVSIVIKGTSTGTTTDPTGTFSIRVPERPGVLIFSFIGYVSQELPYTGAGILNVKLSEDIKSLNEVVVTGYSTEQKKDIVGSVAIVNTKDLLSTPTGNVSSQLQGRTPGVTVSTDGTPGGSAKVRIRGFGSFGGSDPLYVIDGVPATSNASVNGTTVTVNTTSVVDNLNPNDIESVQILKDAAAASIYGARAANGVVIITTKKGKSGTAKFTMDSYYGVGYFNQYPDLLNAKEFGDLHWKAMAGAGLKPGDAAWTHPQYGNGPTPVIPEYILVNLNGTRIGGSDLERLKATNRALFDQYVDPANYDFKNHQIVKSADTDWFRETFKPAPIQSYQIGASGGSEKGSYALSVNLLDQKNPASLYNSYARYSFRANSTFNIQKNIRLGENIQFSYSNSKGTSYVNAAWVFQPLIPVYDIMGNPSSSAAPGLVSTGESGRNPITEAWRNRFDQTVNYGVFGNVFAEVDIIKGLTARTSFGVDYANRNAKDFNQVTYEHAENSNPPNSLTAVNNNSNTWTWTNTLTYGTTFAGKHDFKLLLGSEALKTYAENTWAARTDFAFENDPDFQVLNAGAGAQTNFGNFNRNTLFSLFGRVDYSYADKYLVNATLRRDQSSKFGPNFRTGYFPAVGAGWRISSESFIKNLAWLSDLKLRASWGIIGNQTGLTYDNQFYTYTLDNAESYPITGLNNAKTDSYIASRVGNPNAKWEENTTTNVGVDASLFSNSLDLTVEVYSKQVNGLLVQNQAPLTGVNTTQPYINAGNMTNKGIDIGLSKRGSFSNGLRYDISLTFSKYKNTVTKVLDNPAAFIAGGTTRSGNATLTTVGRPVSFYYGWLIDGFFNTQEEVDAYKKTTTTWLDPAVGRWRIKDINGDGKVDANDRTYMGSPHPDFQSSLNMALNYRNFDFTAFFFWNQGGSIFNYSRYMVDFNTFAFNRSRRMLDESWRPDHMDALLPKLDISDVVSSRNLTNYFVEDATYVRLKTLQIGYSLPKALLGRLKVDRLRVYAQAQNLFTLTKFSGLDPDTGQSGSSDLSMGVVLNVSPTPKQLIFGVSLGF